MKSRPFTPLLVLALFIVFCAIYLPHRTAPADAVTTFPTAPLSIQTRGGAVLRFTVEVATTSEQIERGLMFRKVVPENTGMIFDLGKTQHIDMWMKNTLVPLDMVFIGPDGVITQIAKRTTPLSTTIIPSERDARAVLELAGGVTDKLHIAKGDKVVYPLFP